MGRCSVGYEPLPSQGGSGRAKPKPPRSPQGVRFLDGSQLAMHLRGRSRFSRASEVRAHPPVVSVERLHGAVVEAWALGASAGLLVERLLTEVRDVDTKPARWNLGLVCALKSWTLAEAAKSARDSLDAPWLTLPGRDGNFDANITTQRCQHINMFDKSFGRKSVPPTWRGEAGLSLLRPRKPLLPGLPEIRKSRI